MQQKKQQLLVNRGKANGFTLIELMIAVAIVAIIAAVAFPSYQDSLRKSRRSDAKNKLLEIAKEQERWYFRHGEYADEDDWNKAVASGGWGAGGTTITSDEGYYEISVEINTSSPCSTTRNTCYTLTATPVSTGPQASDGYCATLTLDQAGTKGATGSQSSSCW